jgi:hypothetical protein
MDNKHIFFVFLVVVIYMVHRQIKYSDNVKEDAVVNSLETVKKNDSSEKESDVVIIKNPIKNGKDFVFPSITTISEQLTSFVNKVMYPEVKDVPNTPLEIIRTNPKLSQMVKDAEKHSEKVLPVEDTIVFPNPQNTTEYHYVDGKYNEPWSDIQVSGNPKHHTSEVTSVLTDTGGFFDKENQFNDNTSPNSLKILPDRCFLNENNEVRCNYNNRHYNVPTKLADPTDKVFTNIGKEIVNGEVSTLENNSYSVSEYEKDSEMNGALFFNDVKGFTQTGSSFLELDKLPVGKKYTL